MAKQGYYAIARGYNIGVYDTWAQAEPQIKGFPDARHKKFRTREEAQKFIQENNAPAASSTVPTQAQSSAIVTSQAPSSSASGASMKRPHRAIAGNVQATTNSNLLKRRHEDTHEAFNSAFAFLAEPKLKKAKVMPPASLPNPRDPSTLVAFTDGSSFNNGRRGCKAGYAAIFPHNTSWNVSEPLLDNPTNNRAEYLAALKALERANMENPSQTQALYIFTDSRLLIRSMTQWVQGWRKKGWVKSDGEKVLNQDILKRLLAAIGSRHVEWRHVKAHTRKKDWYSYWNDQADQAARQASESQLKRKTDISSAWD